MISAAGRGSLVACALAVTLVGCSFVATDRPIFGAADMALAQMKPGLWSAIDPGCASSRPASSCNAELIVTSSDVSLANSPFNFDHSLFVAPSGPATAMPYVLASGDPLILQVKGGDDGDGHLYRYLAVRPLKQDGVEIVAAEVWPVSCGEPVEGGSVEQIMRGYKSLLPGLKAAGSMTCTSLNTGDVRGAAAASQKWAYKSVELKWLGSSG